MLCRVALVRSDVSGEFIAYFTRVTRIGELGTTLAVTSNRRTLRRNTCHPEEGGAKFFRKVGFLQEPHIATSQKTPFFIVTAVKTSNLARIYWTSLQLVTAFYRSLLHTPQVSLVEGVIK
jgi:hypothetical protein